MKFHHMISLLQTNYTTVKVRFLNGRGGTSEKDYTYKVPLDAEIQVEDFVVVDTSTTGYTIAQVVKVDESPDINLDAPYPYSWIVQKIDLNPYHERREREQRINKQLFKLEQRKQQVNMVEQFRAMLREADLTAFESVIKELNS